MLTQWSTERRWHYSKHWRIGGHHWGTSLRQLFKFGVQLWGVKSTVSSSYGGYDSHGTAAVFVWQHDFWGVRTWPFLSNSGGCGCGESSPNRWSLLWSSVWSWLKLCRICTAVRGPSALSCILLFLSFLGLPPTPHPTNLLCLWQHLIPGELWAQNY